MQIAPQRLLVLRAVWRTGSVQGAAGALHLTPSGVSQHLTRLERQTGLSLVDRSQRGGGRLLRLTPSGVALAEQAERVAVALSEAEREAERLQGGVDELVRVGGFATTLSELAAPAISSLAISQPGFQVVVTEVERADGLELLRAGDIDLLLSERDPGAVADPALVEEDVLQDPYRIVVPKLRPAEDVDLRSLLAGSWVTAPETHLTRQVLDRLGVEHGVAPAARHLCVESRTRLALVAAGMGAAIISDLTLSAFATVGVSIFASGAAVGSRSITVLRRVADGDQAAVTVFRRELHRAARAAATSRPGGPPDGS